MHDIILVLVIALVTLLTRALPFLIFRKGHPPIIDYFGKVLPYAIMAMLVVYCLKGVDLLSGYHGLPEIIASVSVILLHIYKRNTLVSIFCGTIIYMICIQFIFI